MLTILALNVNSPSRLRARRQLAELRTADADVVVLTEVKQGEAGQTLVSGLRACGFDVLGWAPEFDGFTTLIATRVPYAAAELEPGRVQRITLRSSPGISILAAYGVSSDPFRRNSVEKVAAKRRWLDQFIIDVRSSVAAAENLLVIGDLNIVDDRAVPQYKDLYDFEKTAYIDMLSANLTDLLRDAGEYSWSTHQGHGFRYDHAFATAGLRPHIATAVLEHRWRRGDQRITDHSAIRVTTSVTFSPRELVVSEFDQQPRLF